MKKYIFSGRVMPERTHVSGVDKFESKFFIGSNSKYPAKITININFAQITAIIAVDPKASLTLGTLKIIVENQCRILIDAYGYLTGRGYDVEITTAIDENENQTVFGVGNETLEEDEKKRPLNLNELIPIALQHQQLQFALFDLRQAIRSPLDTGFFCYRAMESIRQDFADDKDKKKEKDSKEWQRMGNALRVDVSYVKIVSEHAFPQRHGQRKEISASTQNDILKRTWRVMDRYCAYLQRSRSQLPKEFETLR